MPTLPSEQQDLRTASTRLSRLRDRTRAAVEWCMALLILGGVLWLVGSDDLAFAVGAGAVAAVAIGALAVDERRRLLLALVIQGDATSIPEVGALAERLAHDPMQRRRVARALRTAVRANRHAGGAPGAIDYGRIEARAPRLLALADAIDDERHTVTPSAIALCRTLLSDGAGSPLYNPNLSERELDRTLAVVEAGIAPSARGQVAAGPLAADRLPARTPERRSAAG